MKQTYFEFVEKFKPKKTTDDCYTPENIYNCVRDYVCRRWEIDPGCIVRPFWPGGNYETFDYPPGCLVLDNPPFSIVTRISRFFVDNGIRFFLFGPSLTLFIGSVPTVTALVTGTGITYENGADVMTGFLHNLTPELVAEACPELGKIIEAENNKNLKAQKKQVKKLSLPVEIITAARLQYFAHHDTPFTLKRSEALFIRKVDNYPSGIFGGGYLMSERAAAERAAAERAAAERAAAERAAAERAAAERAAAERVELSPREKELQRLIH